MASRIAGRSIVGSPPTHWSVQGTLRPALLDRPGEELRREPAAAAGVERVDPGDAEPTPQVATREVEQVRGDQLPLLAVLHPVLVHPRHGPGLARSPLTGLAIDPAPMLAEPARPVMAPRLLRPISGQSQHGHDDPSI